MEVPQRCGKWNARREKGSSIGGDAGVNGSRQRSNKDWRLEDGTSTSFRSTSSCLLRSIAFAALTGAALA